MRDASSYQRDQQSPCTEDLDREPSRSIVPVQADNQNVSMASRIRRFGAPPHATDPRTLDHRPTSGTAHEPGFRQPTFENVMKELRQNKGWSYRQLARAVHYSHGYLWQLETGTKRATEAVAATIDRALGAEGRLVALARNGVPAEPEIRTRPSWLIEDDALDDLISVPIETKHGVVAYLVTRRDSVAGLQGVIPGLTLREAPFQPLPPTRHASDVRAEDVLGGRPVEWSSFLTVTQLLASQRQSISPEVLLSLVEAHRDCLDRLFRKANSDPLRSEIARLLGETSIVASRLWSAKGNRAMAIANCSYARQLADSIDAPDLGATARIFESNLHSEAANLIGADGNILLGLRMLDEAACMERHLPAAARARIAAEQAQAYAVLKLRGECERALVRARNAAELIGDQDRHGLFSDWLPSRLSVYEGTCALFLGDTKKAAVTLSRVVEDTEADQSNVNVRLAAQVDLGSAYAEGGELEEGCRILGITYRELLKTGSRRGLNRALCARKRLQLWDSEASVRDLDALMAAHN